MRDAGFAVHSNEPLEKGMQLADSRRSTGHTLLDMGADEFTQGHPHPMVDSSQRAERILAEADDPQVAALLLDVILGYSAAADPAGDLAPAIRKAKQGAEHRGGHLIVAASICGTPDDPQGLEVQTNRLKDAGAIVFATGFSAAQFASAVVAGEDYTMDPEMHVDELLRGKIEVVNIGVEDFADTLRDQGIQVVHVRWSPPAGGDPEMMKILEKLL